MSETERTRLKAYESVLRLFASRGCTSHTTGIGSCFRHGLRVNALYGADQACEGCIAHAVLTTGEALPCGQENPHPLRHVSDGYCGLPAGHEGPHVFSPRLAQEGGGE